MDPTTFDPTVFFAQLGVASAVVAVLVWVILDVRKQRDEERKAAAAERAKYDDLVGDVLPLIKEFPHIVRLNTEAVNKNTSLLSDVVQATGRNLSEAEATRVRDLLMELSVSRRQGQV